MATEKNGRLLHPFLFVFLRFIPYFLHFTPLPLSGWFGLAYSAFNRQRIPTTTQGDYHASI
jgi:hypothetical protein